MSDVMESNKVTRTGNKMRIRLNQPENFIYDIDDIIVEYDVARRDVEIDNDSIPEFIKDNMKGFFKGDVKRYVRFLEENLEIFFKGKIPEAPDDRDQADADEGSSEEHRRPYELPSSYQLPTEAKVPSNVSFEAEKRSIFIVVCKRISLQVECSRCRKVLQMSESMACPGCKSQLEMKYIPTINQEFLGFLSIKGCRLLCFNPTRYQFTCDKCDMNYETYELGIGSAFRLKCYGCSSDMFLKVTNIGFIQQKKEVVKVGQPLPDKGACKHYKKSYRWFRFPCCKSLYPCDVCHDEQSGHPHQIANKMVCGLCSKEQGISKACECGMNLKKSTAFWEGGKGSRDKATMSRKDKKKYMR